MIKRVYNEEGEGQKLQNSLDIFQNYYPGLTSFSYHHLISFIITEDFYEPFDIHVIDYHV